MIKFFRKIRYDLMEKNKTGKYLKYAIGEIVLVVIGILIALQINNWNEARKQNLKQSIYLSGLKTDLNQSKTALIRVINKTQRVAKTADTFLTLIKRNGDALSQIQIDSLSGGCAGFTVFMPREGVINDIIGSGKLDMIKNNVLRTKIASWDADLKMIRENEILSKNIINNYNEHLSQYFDHANFKFGKTAFLNHKRTDFLNDNIMTNYISDIYGLSLTLNELYREKSITIDSIIDIINSELK